MVAVVTASFADPMTAPRIVEEFEDYLEENNIAHISDLVGAVED